VTDGIVDALGKFSEGLEIVEQARGYLHGFHRLIGSADFLFEEAADRFEAEGETERAEYLRAEIIGRNVLDGRWTFQILDEFNDLYYTAVKAAEESARQKLAGGVRHLQEAEMKERRRSRDRAGHESRPPERGAG
jgi:hypothetical protein